MSGDNKAPIIIKRKKKGGGDGHHGGAWKVAYADFVTAMMAFFMLMWLLNATTENQRKGLADYFAPTIAIARVSGGGTGAFGGDSMLAENTLPENGRGGFLELPPSEFENPGSAGSDSDEEAAREQELLEDLKAGLIGKGGESLISENAMKHINVRITDEGLVIELFDLEGSPLFYPDTSEPTDVLIEISTIMAQLFGLVENRVSLAAHTRTYAPILRTNPAWDISTDRAHAQRKLMTELGLASGRVERLTGFGQQKPLVDDSMSAQNNRLEITLLRDLP